MGNKCLACEGTGVYPKHINYCHVCSAAKIKLYVKKKEWRSVKLRLASLL